MLSIITTAIIRGALQRNIGLELMEVSPLFKDDLFKEFPDIKLDESSARSVKIASVNEAEFGSLAINIENLSREWVADVIYFDDVACVTLTSSLHYRCMGDQLARAFNLGCKTLNFKQFYDYLFGNTNAKDAQKTWENRITSLPLRTLDTEARAVEQRDHEFVPEVARRLAAFVKTATDAGLLVHFSKEAAEACKACSGLFEEMKTNPDSCFSAKLGYRKTMAISRADATLRGSLYILTTTAEPWDLVNVYKERRGNPIITTLGSALNIHPDFCTEEVNASALKGDYLPLLKAVFGRDIK